MNVIIIWFLAVAAPTPVMISTHVSAEACGAAALALAGRATGITYATCVPVLVEKGVNA